jgi:hypothetical protein
MDINTPVEYRISILDRVSNSEYRISEEWWAGQTLKQTKPAGASRFDWVIFQFDVGYAMLGQSVPADASGIVAK